MSRFEPKGPRQRNTAWAALRMPVEDNPSTNVRHPVGKGVVWQQTPGPRREFPKKQRVGRVAYAFRRQSEHQRAPARWGGSRM